MTAVLVDTNVLVYAHDLNQFEKQLRAVQILRDLEANESGCVSVQCLAEFFAVTTRGSTPKLGVPDAAGQVERFIRSWRYSI